MRSEKKNKLPLDLPTEEEKKELLAKISASPAFQDAPSAKRLLALLSSKRPPKKGEGIAARLHTDPRAFRALAKATRKRLQKYAESEDGQQQHWLCACPIGGYALTFARITKPTRVFWWAHIDSDRPVIAVCNELMFYQDFANNKIIRFTDVNPETEDKKSQLAELQNRHHDALRDNPDLQPMFLYLVTGEVAAADRFNEWFEQNSGKKAVRKISRKIDDDELFRSSPILLGTSRTNRYVRKFVESNKFSYRHTDNFRETEILHLDKFPNEQENLQTYKEQMCSTLQGVILNSRIQAEGHAFGIVWRMRLPGTRNIAVTIVSSDSTHAMQQIALALVDDKQMKIVLDQMMWPLSKPLPTTFELLFSVLIEPGKVEFTVSDAHLIGWRTYSE